MKGLEDIRKRKRFIMDDDDIEALAKLSKPRFLTLQDARLPQELANEFWGILAMKWGFDVLTVRPDPSTPDPGTFLAVPLEPDYVEPQVPAANDEDVDTPQAEPTESIVEAVINGDTTTDPA